MAAMTKKQRVRAAIAGEPVDRAPVSMWGHDFVREWSAEDLVAATLEPLSRPRLGLHQAQPALDFLCGSLGQYV